jgi:transposase
MTQADRDRLVTLRKAKKKVITKAQAAEELGLSVRQVKRLVAAVKKRGDGAVLHGLKGKPSNHRLAAEEKAQALVILGNEMYRGFGPTYACERLAEDHGIEVSRETVRRWMSEAGLWKARAQRVKDVHVWRPRRSRFGELVQWDTSEHDWLEGRGPRLYLIAMVDDATSRALAQFVLNDSTESNMGMLERWLLRHGRMLACYTDKAAMFQTAIKTKRQQQREGKDGEPMADTQIGRALRELNIVWTPAHSPQAKGRVERFFGTAQDRLVKGMRLAGVSTIEQANAYLNEQYLPWWEKRCTVEPASSDDAHRRLERQQDLAAILCHVEKRTVKNGYVIQYGAEFYRLQREDVRTGLRGARVRVEQRRDGTIAVRFGEQYVRVEKCETPPPAFPKAKPDPGTQRTRKGPNAGGKSRWMENFQLNQRGPSLHQAIKISNATS